MNIFGPPIYSSICNRLEKEANEVNDLKDVKRREQKEHLNQSGTNKIQIYISTIHAMKHSKTLLKF